MSEFDEWFKLKFPTFHNDYLAKDNIASVIHAIGQDSWNHQQKKIDAVLKHIENNEWVDEYGDKHCSVQEIKGLLK